MKTKTYVKGIAAFCALAAVACTGVQQPRGDVAVYLDESQPLEKRVEDALSRLTLEEKVGLLHAQSKFSSAGVPRLGIPEVVQLYIGDKLSSLPRPVKELKGFEKVHLAPGQSRTVTFEIDPGMLATARRTLRGADPCSRAAIRPKSFPRRKARTLPFGTLRGYARRMLPTLPGSAGRGNTPSRAGLHSWPQTRRNHPPSMHAVRGGMSVPEKSWFLIFIM